MSHSSGSAFPPSVYDRGRVEAEIHKWIESQKRGRDVGPAGYHDWHEQFWLKFCKFRRIEHLAGCCQWREFAPEDFGKIAALRARRDQHVDAVLDLVMAGGENLSIYVWAWQTGVPATLVREVLIALNLNASRLPPFPEPPPA